MYKYIDIDVKKYDTNKLIIVNITKIRISIKGWILLLRVDEITIIIIKRIKNITVSIKINEIVIVFIYSKNSLSKTSILGIDDI